MSEKTYIVVPSMTGTAGDATATFINATFLVKNEKVKRYPDPDFGSWLIEQIYKVNKLLAESGGFFKKKFFCPSCLTELAYISSPEYLNILDLQTWNTHQFPLHGFCSEGHMLWAPTEDRIVLQAATCDNGNGGFHVSSYSLVLFNLIDGVQKKLWTTTERLPQPLEWAKNYPEYIDRDYTYSGKDKCWFLNLDVGELQAIVCP